VTAQRHRPPAFRTYACCNANGDVVAPARPEHIACGATTFIERNAIASIVPPSTYARRKFSTLHLTFCARTP
jgi:hypothetical protein